MYTSRNQNLSLVSVGVISGFLAFGLIACSFSSSQTGEDDPSAALQGTIAYPFVDETRAIGEDRASDDKFVIRSTVGAREYSIEIPGAARDYDVQVPLADLGETDADVISGKKPKSLGSTVATDKELVNALPRLERDHRTDAAMLDSAFGTGGADGPKQAPSYTLGLAKINDLYKTHKYEFALVELNNMLAYYPNSPKLYKMKGTVLIKMRDLRLAELAWIKALELDPADRVVRAALAKLQNRIVQSGLDVQRSQEKQGAIPPAVGTAPTVKEPVLSH
ncbi:hypothetical protein E3A20_12210 [Planctomyces bekefii]|uniref:Uncharacterized protein n=1 Tax=Planctomyces bekefii TaxID=1653850 RepID=A0A5C6M4E7_9PLAN|nr:hypothetical protein E3A20_12210 [Planctomyces bekefii]